MFSSILTLQRKLQSRNHPQHHLGTGQGFASLLGPAALASTCFFEYFFVSHPIQPPQIKKIANFVSHQSLLTTTSKRTTSSRSFPVMRKRPLRPCPHRLRGRRPAPPSEPPPPGPPLPVLRKVQGLLSAAAGKTGGGAAVQRAERHRDGPAPHLHWGTSPSI